jgi:hypothetical protein
MSKKFNIHEWQANQAKQRLEEKRAIPSDIARDKAIDKDEKYRDIKEENIDESLNPEVSRSVDRFITAMASRYGYNEQDAVFAIMAALRQRNFDGVNEAEGVKHYTKDGKEWTGPTHKMPNGKLMTQNPHNEDSEELFHKEDLDEMSTLGTGASFNAGSGEGYMTPNAFKKKKKK